MSIDRDEETGQTIISAVGEAQVSVLLNRLEDRTKVAAKSVPIRIPYRETIRRTASARVATRSRPAAPVSTATAGCAWNRSLGPTARATAMSLLMRSWVAASRARSSPPWTRRPGDHEGRHHCRLPAHGHSRGCVRRLVSQRRLQRDGVPRGGSHRPAQGVRRCRPGGAGAHRGNHGDYSRKLRRRCDGRHLGIARSRDGMETDERGDTVVIAQAPLAELTGLFDAPALYHARHGVTLP